MVRRFGKNEKSLIGFLLLASLGGAFIFYFSLLIVSDLYYITKITNRELYYYRVISIGASSIIALVFWFLTKTGMDQTAIDDENLMLVSEYLSNPVRAGEYAVSKGISEEDVYRLVREGKLEAYSFKKQLYVSDT